MAPSDTTSYRDRIYARYATCFKDAAAKPDLAAADHWGLAYDAYLRGWLPAKPDARIADLACGSGSLLRFFLRRGFTQVCGVDISAEQVALARQICPEATEGGVIEFLDVHRETFDLITGLDIIEHLTKDEAMQFLDRCFAALRPGGRLILQTPNAECPWFGTIRYGDLTHEISFTPDSLGRLLKLCGLSDIEARPTGPVGSGVRSLVRRGLWAMIRAGLKLWNVAETGGPGSGIFTRVFLITGRKA